MADLPHLCVHPLIILSLLYCIGIGTISLLDAISTVTMTSSYSSALSEFFNLHTTAKDWTCQEINISVATSLDDDTPRDINLADTLGYRKNVQDGRLSGGMESIPTLVHSVRKPKRKTTASSPNSNVKRQRR